MSELFEAAKPLLARFAAYLEQHPEQKSEWTHFLKSALAFAESGTSPVSMPAYVRSESRSYSPGSGSSFSSSSLGTDPDREQVPLATMAQRCRIKAEASRVLVRRYSNPGQEPEDTTALYKKASELPDCGLWMLTGSGFNTSPTVWENLAGAYEAASYACDLMDRVLPRNDVGLEIGLNLAAESQSTLLYAVIDTGRRGPDTDQIELFIRIRETGALRRIYIPKFLKRDDRADPDNWKDVLSRLQKEFETYKNSPTISATMASGATAHAAGSGAKGPGGKAEKTMHSLRYQFKKLKESTAVADWDWVFKLIDEAIQNGVAANDPELRELVLPLLSAIPDDVPAAGGTADVFKEIDKHLMSRGADDRSTEETPSPQVTKVATMLGGKEIALIGGLNRPTHTKAIVEAFDLANLKWISAPEVTSPFENEIAKPEIAMVLFSSRWSGLRADEVQAVCEKLKKPLVKLTKGLGPNQVASDIAKR